MSSKKAEGTITGATPPTAIHRASTDGKFSDSFDWGSLPSDLSTLTVAKLRAACLAAGLPTIGLKAELSTTLEQTRAGQKDGANTCNVKEGCDTTVTPDPWVAAAATASSTKYPTDLVLTWSDPQVLLDPFLWPCVLICSHLSVHDLRTEVGTRTAVAEQIWQLWRQVSLTTEIEASQLIKALEEIALCVAAAGNSSLPGSFFVRHRERLLSARSITNQIEARMIRSVDPLVAHQVETRNALSMLPLSAGSAELALKAKIDLKDKPQEPKRGDQGSDQRGRNSRVIKKRERELNSQIKICKYCKEEVTGGIFKHFKECAKAKEFRKKG